MTKANLLKNPVLRNKVESNVSNPAGDISREIAEQELNGETGGITLTNQIKTNNTCGCVCNPTITIGINCKVYF